MWEPLGREGKVERQCEQADDVFVVPRDGEKSDRAFMVMTCRKLKVLSPAQRPRAVLCAAKNGIGANQCREWATRITPAPTFIIIQNLPGRKSEK